MAAIKLIARSLVLMLIMASAFLYYGCEEPTNTEDPGANNPNPVINFNNAVGVNLGAPVQGFISTKGGYNVYSFSNRRGGVFDMKVDTVPGNLDMNIDFYDAQKNWLYGNYGSWGQSVNLSVVRPPGNYYAVVKDGGGDATSSQPFSFIVDFDSTDIYEYNNTLATARTIAINQEIQGKLKPQDDEDAFQFYNPKDGIVQFTLSDVPSNLDIVTDLYDYQNNYMGGITGGTGTGYTFGSMLFAGTYFIKFKDGFSNAYSNDFYKIKMNLDTSDFWEINNTFGYAKGIALNQNVSGKINPVGDADMFKISIPSTGQLQVAVTQVPPEITMVIELYDSTRVKVANAIGLSNGQPVTLFYNLTRPWMYYVRLTDEYDNDISNEYFNLRVVK